MAVAMNLEEDNVGAMLLGPTHMVKEGMTVRRTGRIASVNVGESMIGRVVDPLGNVFTSPAGLKQYTLSENRLRSFLIDDKNSLLSDISFCHSNICLSQLSFASSLWSSFSPVLPSLYFQ